MKIDSYTTRYRYVDDAWEAPPAGVFQVSLILSEDKVRIELCGADYLCPCDCGELMYLPLSYDKADDVHTWGFLDVEKRPTVIPSVLHRLGCLSHYYIQDGKVKWC